MFSDTEYKIRLGNYFQTPAEEGKPPHPEARKQCPSSGMKRKPNSQGLHRAHLDGHDLGLGFRADIHPSLSSLSPDTVASSVAIYELPVFTCETVWELEGKEDKQNKAQLSNC